VIDLDMTDLPDPVAKAIQCLVERVQELERELEGLKRELTVPSLRPPRA